MIPIVPLLLLNSIAPWNSAVLLGKEGWHDEMDRESPWAVYSPGHPPKIDAPRRGLLRLTLPHVLRGWPYEYQWSGIRRTVHLDVRNFPILSAHYADVMKGSYTHLELDVLDSKGNRVKSLRSETILDSGTINWDLGKLLDPAEYTVDLRVIVGGDNSGCSITLDYIRARQQLLD